MGPMGVDWIAIVVAAIVNMIINFVWYSKWLFGKKWCTLAKMKESEMGNCGGAIAWSVVISLLMAFFLDWFEMQMGVLTVQDGMFVGFCVWLGFIATTQSSAVVWCKKPFSLFMIETGNRLLAFLAMGGILGS